MDIKSAFLNGVLEEEIYMHQPPGFLVGDGEIYVCRMQKALYGLKQAPRVWNQTINKFLLNLGFTRSEADHCIYSNKDLSSSLFSMWTTLFILQTTFAVFIKSRSSSVTGSK
jgi:hypothetical protein